ncbi:MAG: DUF1282 family protein [Gammaproteobacteria bacterium]|nr:DUF1282 family protein [Gammaproteobacteria bacterium]
MTAARITLLHVLLTPSAVFARWRDETPSAARIFFGMALWLLLCPPLFAYIGTSAFGWHLGVEPIELTRRAMLGISVAYFALLVFGLFSTAFISRWMAGTYGAKQAFGPHLALITIVGAPLAVGSIVHMYPHAFLNVVVLVPVLIWSMYLLYRGLPVVLETDQGRGMLMASALIAYLLVAWVGLLGVTVVLWSRGIGPMTGA